MVSVRQGHCSYFVILGGAYVPDEIAAELGRLPPPFLPLGNARLFEQQLKRIGKPDATPVLSVPAAFQLSPYDLARLEVLKVQLVRVPEGLKLGQSVKFVLDAIDAQGALFLLHGDTLVELDDASTTDVIASGLTDQYYAWADVLDGPGGSLKLDTGGGELAAERKVACGYFSFSSAAQLRTCLHLNSDFVEAVNAYAQKISMRSVLARRWLDFGHLPLYYRSRNQFLVSRSFNNMRGDGLTITKSSADHKKIDAESKWFETAPGIIKLFTPQFVEGSEGNYKLEYLFLPTLNEMAVFGKLPAYVWKSIMSECIRFLTLMRNIVPDRSEINDIDKFSYEFFSENINKKTINRIKKYLGKKYDNEEFYINNIKLGKIKNIVEYSINKIQSSMSNHISMIHGDLFFGNMMFDFRSHRIKVIDPRGLVGNSVTKFGDFRYDVAKLAHSVIGRYDFILAGQFRLGEPEPGRLFFECADSPVMDVLEQDFRTMQVDGAALWTPDIARMTALLFLSATPLHDDDPVRQRALFANGLRLLAEVEGRS